MIWVEENNRVPVDHLVQRTTQKVTAKGEIIIVVVYLKPRGVRYLGQSIIRLSSITLFDLYQKTRFASFQGPQLGQSATVKSIRLWKRPPDQLATRPERMLML